MARLLLSLPSSVPSSTSNTPISSSSTQSTPTGRRRRSSTNTTMVLPSTSPPFDNDNLHSEYYPGPPPVFKLNPPSRQILSRKLTTQLLTPLTEKPFKTLDMSGSAFSDSAAVVAGPALIELASKKCLHTVILSDIIATLSKDEACRSLSTIASSIGVYKGLRAVDLSRNAIGTMGMPHCAPLLEDQPYLEKVDLHNAGISAQSARLLSQFLTTKSSTALRSLDVHANCLESEGLEYIANIVSKSTGLEKLCVSNVRAFAPAMLTLCQALAKTPNMRDLDISDNDFSLEAASALSDALQTQDNLARLILSDLNMTPSLLSPIASALSATCPPIRQLDLSNNDLDDTVGEVLPSLLSAVGSTLVILDLSSNELSSEGISSIAEGIARIPASAPLASINIALNNADVASTIKLAAALAPRASISKFVIHGNDVPYNICVRIAATFPPSVVEYDDVEEDNYPDSDKASADATSAEKEGNQDAAGQDGNVNDDQVVPENDGGGSSGESGLQPDEAPVEAALQALEALGLARGISETAPDLEGGAPLISVVSSEVTTSVSVPMSNNEEMSPAIEKKFTVEDSEKTVDGTSAGNADNKKIETGNIAFADTDAGADSAVGAVREPGDSDRPLIVNNEDKVESGGDAGPSTPPPSRFLGFVGSQMTPQDEEVVGEATEVDPEGTVPEGEGDIEGFGERNVMDSARKLKASIVSLSREISDVAGELKMTVDGPPVVASTSGVSGVAERSGEDNDNDNDNDNENENENENDEDVNNFLLVGDRIAPRNKHSSTVTTLILDCVGGCIIALFVIVLVLAIVQSQEEATFSYRFV